MKKYFVFFALLVLGLALLLVSVPTQDVDAQGRVPVRDVDGQGRADDPGNKSARRKGGIVVAPDGVIFESAKAFVDAGRKCKTRDVDDIEIEEIENEVRMNRGEAARVGGGGDSENARLYPNGSILIPVHFHVVFRSDGTGNIAEAWLDNQVNAMNEHYTGLDTPA